MNKKTITYVTDIEHLMKQWDYKNNTKDPTQILISSAYKAYWICPKGHHFVKAVRNMSVNSTCLVCKKLSTTVYGKAKMMKFWDYKRNTIDPKKTPAKSSEYAWWSCPKCNYTWKAQIRTRNTGLCPCCDTNMKIVQGINDVFSIAPELAKDFLSDMNPDIIPGSLGIGSHERINWKCHICSYEWTGPIYRRIRHQPDGTIKIGKCPVCGKNRRLISFAEEYPELIPLYATENEHSIYQIKGNPKIKYLWTCKIHGNYQATLRSILRSITTGNTGCPYCHGTKVHINDSLGIKYPEIAKEWSPRNNKTAFETTPGSKDSVEWICEKGHTWTAPVYTRVAGYGKCRFCYPFGINGMGFAERYPELKQYYDHNNEKAFDSLYLSDPEDRMWTCNLGHKFLLSPKSINHNKTFNCPICSHRIIISGINDFKTEYPQYAEYYDSEKNQLSSDKISPISSDSSTWFNCPENHSFQRSVRNHILSNGSCPICNNKVLSIGNNDLLTAHPQIKYIWDYQKNKKKPEECMYNINISYFWTCNKKHSYSATLKSIKNNHFKCLVCNNLKVQNGYNDLVTTHPELASQWSKTNASPPENYLKTSKVLSSWICPTCHGEYTARICDREVDDNLCPYCNGSLLLKGFNDLLSQKPLLAQEWSSNNDRTADTVIFSSAYSALWICPSCGNEYRKSVNNRETGDDSCPFCTQRKLLIGFNDLNSTNPVLAKEWSTNNIKYSFEVLKKSTSGGFWICSKCGGEYWARLCDRSENDDSCPYCSCKKVLTGFNDLQTTDPALSKEYSTKNDKSTSEIMKSSSYRALWICPSCNNNYYASVKNREVGDDCCPYCNGKKILVGFNDLLSTHPTLSMEWSPNNDKKPSEVMKSSAYRALWICPSCHNEYISSVKSREINDDGCPYCNQRIFLAGVNDLVTTDPVLSMEWSPNNAKKPSEVMKSYAYRALWICQTCHNEYYAPIRDRKIDDKCCPYCNQRFFLAGMNDLATTNPALSMEWSPNNDKKPSEVMKSYAYRALWICQTCHNEYRAPIKDRIIGDNLCPYCNNKKVFSGLNDLATIDSKLSLEWSPNNEKKPSEVTKSSHYYALWICPICHGEYSALVSNRKVGDNCCPYCNNRRILPGFNSFKVKHSELLIEWDYVNNYLLLDPDEIGDMNDTPVWWICKYDTNHHYTMSVHRKLIYHKRNRESCPYCKGLRIKKRHFV